MIGIVVGLIVVCTLGFVVFNNASGSAQKSFESYIAAINSKDYDKAYETIANKKEWKKADFIKRVKNIYQGIDMKQLRVDIKDDSTKDDITTIQYDATMNTIAGKVTYTNEIKVIKNDEGYQLDWDSSQILSNLKDDEKVSVQMTQGARGSILDRNGTAIATQGTAFKVGFIAGQIGDTEKAVSDMAVALDITKDSIDKKLRASWIQDGMFVPIKTIHAKDKEALSDTLNQIDGASIQQSIVRDYPYGEMLAHVSGYVQNISQEELKKLSDDGYDETSLIGKDGLEQVYEKQLKPSQGYRIVIVNENGSEVSIVKEKQAKNGDDITTTIDVNAQQAMYDQLLEDAGAGVMMDSKTGEVLAMVSMPSYDPNTFVLGLSQEAWDGLNNPETTPLINRTTSLYSPGSTFKAITGSIGIDTDVIRADSTFEKSEQWQKDKSWGDNYVSTTKAYEEPSNLLNAYINSDNIYFAQLSDQIGKTKFSTYLDAIGFKKKIAFPLSLDTSSYGKLDSDQAISAAGYGQGDIMVSPLHLTSLYTAYKNDGTILKPTLIYEEGKKQMIKKQAYKSETAQLIFEDLKQTMDSYGVNPSGAAGKTGTAQIKHGEQEIGWICSINDRYAMSIMVDDTKEIGQSHYVIPKAQAILASY